LFLIFVKIDTFHLQKKDISSTILYCYLVTNYFLLDG